MLKKNDLAKQFELVVKQEIKNYQDSLNFVLQSIQGLKEAIEETKNESLENHAAIHSIQCVLGVEIQNFRNEFASLKQQVERIYNDQRVINERNSKEMLDMADALHGKIRNDARFDQRYNELSNAIHGVRLLSEETRESVSSSSTDLLRKFLNAISKTKREILDAPSEVSLVKTTLEEKIAMYRIDVAGIMKELNIFKHDNMVTQKKIEQIHTQIERLKKSEALH